MNYSQFTLFCEPSSPFSQWYFVDFIVNGVTYNCAEQYMMHQKACLFDDKETANKILESKTPEQQQALGREVRHFDSLTWKTHCREIVYAGNYAKFTQNQALYHVLMQTKGTLLVEAYAFDQKWSIGISEDDPRAHDQAQWRGTNWIGYILTKLRDDIDGMFTIEKEAALVYLTEPR